MFIGVSPSNPFHSGFRQNGAFEVQYAGKLMLHAVETQEAAADPRIKRELVHNMVHLRDWLRRLPWREGESPFSPLPRLERLFFDMYTRGEYEEFWRDFCINFEEHYGEHSDVPTYYQTGWYDSWLRGTIENYVALRKAKEQPLKLIVGGWTHGGFREGDTHAGDVDFGAGASLDGLALELRWSDRWLKGLETGIDHETPVHVSVTGAAADARTATDALTTEAGGARRVNGRLRAPGTPHTTSTTMAA